MPGRVFIQIISMGVQMNQLTKLRLSRLENGLSQYQVTVKTGIHQGVLSLYERGLKAPPEQHRKALAKLYQTSEGELFDGR
jgi:transcriptional regulator with XRE-family HTH domain